MKKLMLTILIVMFTSNLFAQEGDTVYIVFASIDNTAGISGFCLYMNPDYDRSLYRYPTRTYKIFDKQKDYYFTFRYFNQNDEPDEPILLKPTSFLDTVTYIDWDAFAPTLTKDQAEVYFQLIIAHSKIYFIDRKEIQNDTMKVVPVKALRPIIF